MNSNPRKAWTADDFRDLDMKYRRLPRAGWTVKGSRKKSNETIEVNRGEVTEALLQAWQSEFASNTFLKEANFYQKLLCAIADGEDDSVSCDKCLGIFRLSWGEKCPYCEVEHGKVLVVEIEK